MNMAAAIWGVIAASALVSRFLFSYFEKRKDEIADKESEERLAAAYKDLNKDPRVWAYPYLPEDIGLPQRVDLLEADKIEKQINPAYLNDKGTKYCKIHNVTYDVGNCLQCDIKNGTGLIGQYAQSIQNPDREYKAWKPTDKDGMIIKASDLGTNKLLVNGRELEKDKEARVKEGDIIEVRNGYSGVLRAQYVQQRNNVMTSAIYATDGLLKSYTTERDLFDINWPMPNVPVAESKLPEVKAEPEELFPQKRKFREIA